jgi:hypothetical protein
VVRAREQSEYPLLFPNHISFSKSPDSQEGEREEEEKEREE